MQKMHNVAARLVAVPGPRAGPPDAWAVARVSRPPDLVPGGRDPGGPGGLVARYLVRA
jgi:hypothetical protein